MCEKHTGTYFVSYSRKVPHRCSFYGYAWECIGDIMRDISIYILYSTQPYLMGFDMDKYGTI